MSRAFQYFLSKDSIKTCNLYTKEFVDENTINFYHNGLFMAQVDVENDVATLYDDSNKLEKEFKQFGYKIKRT